MIIAEPVQNAGGCLVPPEGYWAGLRELADKYGIALVADEVITGFGRIGEWFAAPRYGATPDLITCAKGITSAYAPMGAVIVSDRIAAPLYEEGRMLLHGITYGGHPVAAAIALRNIEIFEREGVLENVRAHEGYLGERLRELQDRLPIVGDVRGAGFFWALELVRDEDGTRFNADERERLLRGFLTGRLLEEGLIARPDDRGDAVLHLAPPLICGERARRDGREDRGGPRRRLGPLLRRGVRHDAHGWWLAEAGPVAPAPPLRGDQRADVVVIGGGYAGLWTAWQLLERGASVALLEAGVCGHGPSGRNGGFAETLWTQPARPRRALRRRARARRRPRVVGERRGDRRLVRGARASTPGSAASGFLLASDRGGPGRRARRRSLRAARARSGSTESSSSRSTAPRCAPAAPRRCSAAACSRPTTRRCTRRGSRSGCASA